MLTALRDAVLINYGASNTTLYELIFKVKIAEQQSRGIWSMLFGGYTLPYIKQKSAAKIDSILNLYDYKSQLPRAAAPRSQRHHPA